MSTPNAMEIAYAFEENPAPLIAWATERLIHLGARTEWSMDDNFTTTESLVELASGEYGLPPAGNQSEDSLRFYRQAERETA